MKISLQKRDCIFPSSMEYGVLYIISEGVRDYEGFVVLRISEDAFVCVYNLGEDDDPFKWVWKISSLKNLRLEKLDSSIEVILTNE